jgi:hypothetical protein
MGTHHNDCASAQGLAAPRRVELTPQSTTPAGGPALQGNHENETGDCAASDDDRKAVITMMAHAAQAGCTLHELASGGYLLCRWGMAKELPCLRAVGDLLRRIGGAR